MKKTYICPAADIQIVEYDNLLKEASIYTINDESGNGGNSTNAGGNMGYGGFGNGGGMNGAKGNSLWDFEEEEDFDTDW